MIKIRQAILEDKPAIFDFLLKAYKDKAQYKFPERWEWQFEKNPFREGNELPVWIAVDDKGIIVGQTCVMFEPLKIGSETQLLSWAADTIVLPEYQGQKLGTKLKKACIESSGIYMSLNMAEATRQISMNLGCRSVDSVEVFNRLTHFDSASALIALRNRLHNKWPGKILLWVIHSFRIDRQISALINIIIGIRDFGLSKFIDPSIEIKQITEFDNTMDEFWDAVSPQFHAIVKRKSKYLNWKYVQQPNMDYQLFSALRDGKICGYVILRKARPPEKNLGIIADLFAPLEDKATVYSLLTFAIQRLKHQKVEHIVAASSINTYKKAFLLLGFKKKKDMIPIFHSTVKSPVIESVLRPGVWFFGRSDHEWDQFPYAHR